MRLLRREFLALGLTLLASPMSAAPTIDGSMPSWEQVVQVVGEFFAQDESRQPLDIISQREVAPLFDKLARHGWQVADRKQILARVPNDGDFIVQRLRSKQGVKFMREFSRYPGGYDSLDRLSRLPQGKSTVERLIQGPDGYKLLQYMDTTQGGLNLEKQLSRTPKGKDFTEPTGKIYTIGELKSALLQSYKKAMQSQR